MEAKASKHASKCEGDHGPPSVSNIWGIPALLLALPRDNLATQPLIRPREPPKMCRRPLGLVP